MKRVLFSGTIFLNLSDRLILALFFCFIFLLGGIQAGKCANCQSYNYYGDNGLRLRDEQTRERLCCHIEKIKLSVSLVFLSKNGFLLFLISRKSLSLCQ